MVDRRTFLAATTGAIALAGAPASCARRAVKAPFDFKGKPSSQSGRHIMSNQARTAVAGIIPAYAAYVTLGARDFVALRDFYRRLGWSLAVDMEDFAAFAMHGAVLGIFPVEKLAADANVEPAPVEKGLRFAVAIVV